MSRTSSVFPRARTLLRSAKERGSEPETPRAPMHEHLREIGAMRLVLGLAQCELDRPADPGGVLRDPEGAIAGVDVARDLGPECARPIAAERRQEAHRRTALDAIDEDVRQRIDVRRIERTDESNRPRGAQRRRPRAQLAFTTTYRLRARVGFAKTTG